MMHVTLIAIALAVTAIDGQVPYNNEHFPRSSPLGKLSAQLIESEYELDDIEARQNGNQNGLRLFNRNPWVALANRLPIIRNPDFPSLFATYDSCTAPDGETGVCLGAGGCALLGGRASGSCVIGTVCCINAVSRCAGTISLNNTYWQTPSTGITPSSTCSVNIRLDQNLPEQKKYPICQVRLDLIAFTIAQPTATTACATDNFKVSGASSQAPTICGDNDGQHMYLTVPSSASTASDIQLTFTFGAGITPRLWNIRVAMIPWGASYAAPPDCLQYYTSSSGAIKSFNWKDVSTTAGVRQLANQDYYACFRSELVNNQRANSICYLVCPTTATGANAFSITGDNTKAQVSKFDCQNDFVVIPGGADSADTSGQRNDRYCGGRLNPQLPDSGTNSVADKAATTNVQVCSSAVPFRMYYRTNGDEAQLLDPDAAPDAAVKAANAINARKSAKAAREAVAQGRDAIITAATNAAPSNPAIDAIKNSMSTDGNALATLAENAATDAENAAKSAAGPIDQPAADVNNVGFCLTFGQRLV